MGVALSAGTGQLRFQTLGRIRLVLLLLLLLPVPGLPRDVTARHAAPARSTHSARGRASRPPAPAAPVPPAPVLRWCQRPSTTRHRLRREWWWTQRPHWRCCQRLRFVPQAAAAPSAAAPRTTKTCLIVHDLRSIRSAHMSLVESSHAHVHGARLALRTRKTTRSGARRRDVKLANGQCRTRPALHAVLRFATSVGPAGKGAASVAPHSQAMLDPSEQVPVTFEMFTNPTSNTTVADALQQGSRRVTSRGNAPAADKKPRTSRRMTRNQSLGHA